jgi:membrane protease YdiL (CAAX protease family)
MATELARPMESGSRALTKLVYAGLFLIVTSGSFYVLLTDYDLHLVATKRFSLARTVEENFSPAQSLFFVVQLLVLLVFFRRQFDFRGAPLNRSVRNILLGVSTGLVALLATLPRFLGSHRPSGAVMFLANHFYSVSGLGLALLLVFLVPVAAEIFFRGIFLRQLLENISVVSALIVSTLLFLLSWPAFNLIAAAALGLAAGILFYRTRSVLACVIANASFTIGAIVLQISRLR